MIHSFFISSAHAADTGAALAGQEPGSALAGFMPLILIFVIFYFLMIRPQQKRIREHQAMLTAIQRGDRIVTGGGIIGTVHKVQDEQTLVVEIAEDVRVKISRPTVSSVLEATGKPANDD